MTASLLVDHLNELWAGCIFRNCNFLKCIPERVFQGDADLAVSREDRPSPGRVGGLLALHSITLVAAGAAGFLTLIQSCERPER